MPGLTSHRILIVDDESAPREMLAKALAARGYSVDTADGVESAVRFAQQKSYDVAIIDYRMPEVNGADLFAHLRRYHSHTVGVFLTGYPEHEEVQAQTAGIERVFAKPVDTQEVVEFIESSVGDDRIDV